MYLEALNGSLIVDVGFLSVDNLPKAVGASCSQSMFSYEILDYCIRKIPCLYIPIRCLLKQLQIRYIRSFRSYWATQGACIA